MKITGTRIDIDPPRATVGQLRLTDKREMVLVDDDVLGVAAALRGIDPGLKMFHDLKQHVFVLYWEGLNERGEVEESLVGAYTVLDKRIVNLIHAIDNQGRDRYDLVRELDRLDAEQQHAVDHAFSEQIGEHAEQLRHALRKDLGLDGSQVHLSGGGTRARGRKKPKRRR